jgi:hypothetical protein
LSRPSKLTPALQQKVCDAVRVGNGFDVAAGFAGIDKTTFHRWMKRGARATRGLYRDFYLAVQKASSDAETRALAIVNKAAPEDWRAAAWFLERKSPERWGRREHHEVDANIKGTVKVTADDAVAELTRLLAARTAPGGTDQDP